MVRTLPPYSPQLNPVENIWDDRREKFFANIVFESTAFNRIPVHETHSLWFPKKVSRAWLKRPPAKPTPPLRNKDIWVPSLN